jgi:hypothetical protein
MEGDFKVMTDLISILKAADNRILYTTTSFTFQKHPDGYPQPVDDFFVTQWTDAGWVRGQFLFDNEYPRFDQDYANASAHLPVPLITHEVGQHTAYPNLRELEKYTGMFEPVYLNWIKGDVEKKGLLPIIDDYVKASGKLQTLLYKEEIERALKTPGIHGFQLLALCDAGGSPVGVIDNFWEPKAYVDGKEFRQFCSEVVPLAWFKKAVHSNAESMVVQAGVANYYQNLTSRKLIGELSDISGRVLQRRELVVQQIPKGTADKYGRFEFDLVKMPAPGQFRLSLRIEGTEYRNSWPIWVYPEKAAITDDQIVITASFDAAEKALHEGKKVLLSPPSDKVKGTPGKFVTVFWSPTHFSHWEKVSEAGTMGLLIDPQHPAFSAFPTEFHSDWQWWDLCKKSETLAYDGTDIQPLITVIDNYHRNRRLTNLFEVAVGKGKLIFSSIDLISSLDERTEARQLRHSLLQYMKSAQFDPKKSISMQSLRQNYEVIAGIWPYWPPRY